MVVAAAEVVVHTLAPVWVVIPVEAELFVALGVADVESVEFEPVD